MAESLLINFSLNYPGGSSVRVDNLRLAAENAMVTVLFGASGSGKTTFLRVLAGLALPDSGSVSFRGTVWFDGEAGLCLPPQDRNIGFVSQDYALFPHLTVSQNVGYGLSELPRIERNGRVRESLNWLGLEELAERRPAEISGGQQQRAALARAVARRPGLLLLDEPLSALDAPTRRRLRGELHALIERTGIPCLVVTHDPPEALALADEIVLMHEGRILQAGTPSEVFNHPASIEAAQILGIDTMVDGTVTSRDGAIVTVNAAGIRLTAVCHDPISVGCSAAVCIRAEDVMLSLPGSVHGSARNRLPGTVLNAVEEAGLTRIEIDCGFLLRATLTRQSCEELGIRVGTKIEAIIKAPNVHIIPR